MTTPGRLGFAGLGQMGAPMAANIANGGFDLVVYDKAGTAARAPDKTTPAATLDDLAAQSETLFLSLPDGPATIGFARDLVQIAKRAVKVVVDLSTIGIEAAREADKIYADSGITYIDAPVSGGQSGARAGTITVMWAGSAELLESHRKVMTAFCKNLFHVGDAAGQGQAMKLVNNYLSATAMTATSEAMAFGIKNGLGMKTMLDVVNVSTGRNTATSDKFVNRVLTGTFDAGFKTKLLTKDVRLFAETAKAHGTPSEMAQVLADIWRRADAAMPDTDFTRIYQFITGKKD